MCVCTHHVTAGSRCARKCRSRTWKPFTTRWDTWSTSWLTVTYLPCTVMALTALSTKPSGTPSRYPSCPERTKGCSAWTPRSLALTITVSICHQLVKVHFCCWLDIVVVAQSKLLSSVWWVCVVSKSCWSGCLSVFIFCWRRKANVWLAQSKVHTAPVAGRMCEHKFFPVTILTEPWNSGQNFVH